MGRCEANSCVVSNHTVLSGILQICHIARTIEDQLLEGQNTTTKGQLYTIVDRYPSPTTSHSPYQLVTIGNVSTSVPTSVCY